MEGHSMQFSPTSISETAILARILEPDKPTLPAAAARAILALDFSAADKERMRYLSERAREGTLTAVEQAAINNYERVGHLLNIMQSKARRSLKNNRGANGKAKSH
jgi:hypothetical protein